MIEPAPHPQKIRVPRGGLYTGVREYACDAALLEVVVEGTREHPRVARCRILELHDLNVGQRRTRHDVGAFLRRCLKRIEADGLIVVIEPQVLSIPPQRITVDKIRFQQFCSRGRADGPFTSSNAVF